MDSKELVMQDMFFEGNFSVDECLSRYTHKSDLESLRREFKSYGAELQQHMSEILRAETEAIVNLAEYLTNLNSRIENLSGPLCQLHEEIMALNNLIHNAESGYSVMLEELKNNNNMQNHIHLNLALIASSAYIDKLLKESHESLQDLLMLERIVNKFSFQKTYVEVLGILTPNMQEMVNFIEDKLIKIVDEKFLDSFKKQDVDILTRCLRMYFNLNKQKEAQETFRKNIVTPYLKQVFTESNLDRLNPDVDKIYSQVLYFVNEKMRILLTVIEENPDLKTYNFTMNSFWKEFDKQSRIGLPYITAPGNPELFQKRFKSTWTTLKIIAEKCGNVNLLTEDGTFQEHIKRFNLPVYFEICYQKITGNFEGDLLLEKTNVYATPNELSCKLQPTLSLWLAISHCFSEDVYIDQLADQFLKLSMMLLSRYLGWYKLILKDSSFIGIGSVWEEFILNSLLDLSIVESLIALNVDQQLDIETTVFKIMNPKMRPIIFKMFKFNKNTINKIEKSLTDNLIEIKYQESVLHLQSVGAIPRLYRRTNRSVPKEASHYIVEAVKPVLEFHHKFQKEHANKLNNILENLILKITKQYLNLVQEVLQSVCKTEESLRRLKGRNLPSNEDTVPQSETMSDEMKIREQIKLDVHYFFNKLYPLASSSSRQTMDMLKKESC